MAYNHKRPPEFLDERIRKRRLEVTGSSRRSELGNRSGGSGHSSSGPLGFPPHPAPGLTAPPPRAARLPRPGASKGRGHTQSPLHTRESSMDNGERAHGSGPHGTRGFSGTC